MVQLLENQQFFFCFNFRQKIPNKSKEFCDSTEAFFLEYVHLNLNFLKFKLFQTLLKLIFKNKNVNLIKVGKGLRVLSN